MTKCCGIIILRSITLHSHEFWVYRLFHGKYKCCNGKKKSKNVLKLPIPKSTKTTEIPVKNN